MNISENPNNELTLSKESNTDLCFIKNEEGKRVAQQLQNFEVKEMKEQQERGIAVIWHMGIGHTQAAIVETLNNSDYQGKTIFVVWEKPMVEWLRDGIFPEEYLKEVENILFMIKLLREDIVEVPLVKQKKSYTDFNKQYIPQTQQKKIQQKKVNRRNYTQRKK